MHTGIEAYEIELHCFRMYTAQIQTMFSGGFAAINVPSLSLLLLLLPPQCPPRTIKRLLDKNLNFHKAIAWMLVLSSAIHVIAHWYNYERLVATLDNQSLKSTQPWISRNVPERAQPDLPFAGVSEHATATTQVLLLLLNLASHTHR